jgi:hypothetical protein
LTSTSNPCAATAAILAITWNIATPTTHELPRHLVKVRDGNDETVHYFHTEEDNTRRAKHVELHESKAIMELLGNLEEGPERGALFGARPPAF